MQLNAWALAGVVAVLAATAYLGRRTSQAAGAGDGFLFARRMVRSRRNASAVAGEFLCAGSFLGVAGLVLVEGADALWFPIGFTVGLLALGIFVSAPLRRSGAYTIPDFVDARLGSTDLRRTATVWVVLLGLAYLVPQFQGVALVLDVIMPGVASWWGPVVVAALIALNVVTGGLHAATLVQAFQHWIKLFATAIPAFVLGVVFLGSGGAGATGRLGDEAPPEFAEETTVSVRTDVLLRVGEPTMVHRLDDDLPEPVLWVPGERYPVSDGDRLLFPAGSAVPVVVEADLDNENWLRAAADTDDLWRTYSVIVATFLGAMGLPHVLARFYTNPDGRAARRTTVQVLLLLGTFYLFPILLGALSRIYVPRLLVSGRTDAAVLEVPGAMLPGVAGQIVVAVLSAGAFTAFVSSSSGLLVSVAGVVSTDVFTGKRSHFLFAVAGTALAAAAGAVLLPAHALVVSVGLAFAMAASTFCPLLLLGIWWRRLTWVGALLGMVVGGTGVLAAYVGNVVLNVSGGGPAPWYVEQPALITVPAAFATMVVVSLATSRRVPEDVNVVMLQLHAPDRLGFMRDHQSDEYGRGPAPEQGRHRLL